MMTVSMAEIIDKCLKKVNAISWYDQIEKSESQWIIIKHLFVYALRQRKCFDNFNQNTVIK